MEESARTFGFAFNRHDIRNELQAAVFTLRQPVRVRLLLGRSGAVAIETETFPALPAEPVGVALSTLPVSPGDFRLRHKTRSRRFYDEARFASWTFGVVFTAPEGRVTESSFTNLLGDRAGLQRTLALQR